MANNFFDDVNVDEEDDQIIPTNNSSSKIVENLDDDIADAAEDTEEEIAPAPTPKNEKEPRKTKSIPKQSQLSEVQNDEEYDLVIDGKVTINKNMTCSIKASQIVVTNGKIVGNLYGVETIEVQRKARVIGNIDGDEVTIHGAVKGDVTGNTISLLDKAVIVGVITSDKDADVDNLFD